MDHEIIIDILEKDGMSDIEKLAGTDNYVVIRFCYDFDKEEISAARAYANEECDLEEGSSEWTDNQLIPFI